MIYTGRFYIETKPFVRAICQAISNQLPRCIFADWLDERGYVNEAFGERWIAKKELYQDTIHHPTGGWFAERFHGNSVLYKSSLPIFMHSIKNNFKHDAIIRSRASNLLVGEYLLLFCFKNLSPKAYP